MTLLLQISVLNFFIIFQNFAMMSPNKAFYKLYKMTKTITFFIIQLTTLNNNIKKCRNIKKLLKTQIENLIVFLNMKLN